MTTFMTITLGKIAIHKDVDAKLVGIPDFVTDSAYEAARYIYDHKINDWTNSSTMDVAKDYGWPRNNAADEVMEELAKLNIIDLHNRKMGRGK